MVRPFRLLSGIRPSLPSRRLRAAQTRLAVEQLDERNVPAAYSYSAGEVYTQNFNTLPTTQANVTAGLGPLSLDAAPFNYTGVVGWQIGYGATNQTNLQLLATPANTTANTAQNYAFSGNTSDRALGGRSNASNDVIWGFVVKNNTGTTLNQFSLSFFTEQYLEATGGVAQGTAAFSYKVGGATVADTGFTTLTTGNAVPKVGSAAAVARVDGNSAAYKGAQQTVTAFDLNWTDQSTLVIRWVQNSNANGAGIAIDDVTFSASKTATGVTLNSIAPLTETSGQPVTFQATVTAAAGTTPPAAGSVEFREGGPAGMLLATASAGTASGTSRVFGVSSSAVPPGSYSNIKAYYIAGAGFADSGTAAAFGSTLTINAATATSIASITPNLSQIGDAVTLSADVTALAGSSAPSGGTVEFRDGSESGTLLAIATDSNAIGLTRTFTVTSNAVPVGSYSSVRAYYKHGVGFANSESPAFGSAVEVRSVPAMTSVDSTVFAEGQSANFHVTATGFPVPTFLLAGSLPAGIAFNESTGAFTGAPDAGAAVGSPYVVTITPTNGSGTPAAQTFTITVTANQPPSAPVDSDAAANEVTEGSPDGSVVGLAALATDTLEQTITYALLDDANGAFEIDSVTGVVSIRDTTKIDFETAATLTIVVRATDDQGLLAQSSTASFAIAVLNANPSNIVDTNNAADEIAEGAANDTPVGITAFATDPNGPSPLAYSLTDDAGGRFKIDAATGVVSVANATLLDYETTTSHTIVVQASDGHGGVSTQSFTIAILNVISPLIDSDPQENRILENSLSGTPVLIRALATDPNSLASSITYSLDDNAGGVFDIVPTTGFVTVASGAPLPSYASGHTYTVVVRATDASGGFATNSFTIHVLRTPGSFTYGNIVVVRVGDGTTSLANIGNEVDLEEYTPAGVLVQAIPLPTFQDGANKPFVLNGLNYTEGLLTRSADGRYLLLGGYSVIPTTGVNVTTSASTVVHRGIARIGGDATYDTSLSLTDAFTAQAFRSVASADGTNLYLTGNRTNANTADVRTVAFTPGNQPTTSTTILTLTTSTQLRQLEVVNDQLYLSSSGANRQLSAVGSGLPTGSTTFAALPGIPSSGSSFGYFFANLDGAPGDDTLYIADDVAGQIQKFGLVSGSWVAQGSIAAPFVRGLTGQVSGSTVTLFGTTNNLAGNNTANGGGVLYSFSDTSGSGGVLSGSAITIASVSVGSKFTFRGIALAPGIAPTITSGNSATFDANAPISFPIVATGSPSPTYQVTGLPSGLSYDANTGLVSGAATTAGTYPLTITAANGIGSAAIQNFTLTINAVAAAPTVLSVTPVIGPTTGGTIVTILGTNFVSITSVTFDGIDATTFTVDPSQTAITATVPAHALAATVDIVVTNAIGSGSLAGYSDFTYALPEVSAVVVNGGPHVALGNTGVSISLAGQHSIVKQILVTFNQAVTVASDAFTVTPRTSNVIANGGAAPSTAAATTSVTALSATEYLVTFFDDGISARNGGLLSSGVYDLTTIAAKVSANGTTLAANRVDTIFAVFGTIDANNSYTPGTFGNGGSKAFVDPGSLFKFSDAFGASAIALNGPPAYNVVFDANLDGAIDPGDLFAFSDAFGIDWTF